jgi:hypothetical protein
MLVLSVTNVISSVMCRGQRAPIQPFTYVSVIHLANPQAGASGESQPGRQTLLKKLQGLGENTDIILHAILTVNGAH